MLNWYTITTRNSVGRLGAVYAEAPDAEAARSLAVHYLRGLASKYRIVSVRPTACNETPPCNATLLR